MMTSSQHSMNKLHVLPRRKITSQRSLIRQGARRQRHQPGTQTLSSRHALKGVPQTLTAPPLVLLGLH